MDANILQSYLAECARLARDLQQVSDDLEFVHDKKGKLRFAVDYSEIYALSHPDETPDEFRLFKDDPTALSSALQKVALERLFFEEAERPILLMPYAAELRDAMIRMEREDHYKMEELIQKVPGFLAWGEQLWSNPETKSLLELVNKASASNASIDPSDEQRLISFFERNTPLILALSKPQSENAFSALMKLFQSKRLEDLEEVLHLSEDTFESETSKRWFVGIHDLRKKYPERERSSDNSSMYDAWAMSILEQANRELAKSSTKLCLVTRSEAMAEMLQSEIRERKWDQLVGNIIRHPRYFSYLQRLDKLDLQRKICSIDWFQLMRYCHLSKKRVNSPD